jgi:hypothetical protein
VSYTKVSHRVRCKIRTDGGLPWRRSWNLGFRRMRALCSLAEAAPVSELVTQWATCATVIKVLHARHHHAPVI